MGECWGKGIMTEAASRILEFAFNELGLNRINSEATIENNGSNKVIQKLGFTFEGLRRQAMRNVATKKTHDANYYGLLKEDLA